MDTARRTQLSATMKAYNQARAAVKEGCLDSDRTNRALGIVMSKNYQTSDPDGYITTLTSCTCKDFIYRAHKIPGGKCKHMIALVMNSTL